MPYIIQTPCEYWNGSQPGRGGSYKKWQRDPAWGVREYATQEKAEAALAYIRSAFPTPSGLHTEIRFVVDVRHLPNLKPDSPDRWRKRKGSKAVTPSRLFRTDTAPRRGGVEAYRMRYDYVSRRLYVGLLIPPEKRALDGPKYVWDEVMG